MIPSKSSLGQRWRIQILGAQFRSELEGLPDLEITFSLFWLNRHWSIHVKAHAIKQAIHVVARASADRAAETGECPRRLSFFSIYINISIWFLTCLLIFHVLQALQEKPESCGEFPIIIIIIIVIYLIVFLLCICPIDLLLCCSLENGKSTGLRYLSLSPEN